MPDVKHMKWWGWGNEGVSFTHEDKPALGPFLQEHIAVDASRPTARPGRAGRCKGHNRSR